MSQIQRIPDRSRDLPPRWCLPELQNAMEITTNQLGDFRQNLREIAKEFQFNTNQPHSEQDPVLWAQFVMRVVTKVQWLNSYKDHWPVKVYFDFWSARRLYNHRWKKPKSTIPEYLKIPLPPKRVYIGMPPPPLRSITNDYQTTTEPSSRNAKFKPRLISSTPFKGPYDIGVCIPCSHKNALAEIGVLCDLDLDTFILLGSDRRKDLFLSTASTLSNYKIESIESVLNTIEHQNWHVRQGVSEKDLHKYLEHIFNCLEHPIFDEETVIPRQLHRLFNRQHIEHLIPLAMSLGIDSDARYDEIVLQLDEDERNERLFNNEDIQLYSCFTVGKSCDEVGIWASCVVGETGVGACT
ncbi:hypothetical protein BT96DRAFT_528285 [Gymnopus androsaceus JB14]|uniref:Uncharacterized protein n=1 Tax=Gymnopus androsaceus JB14 TaxID=1447944 RepID=A0A6A4IG55_9AGAR|nr:hypothetical protein BT96DRAFT_528285 [Gymnopus androsaceus JB14]